jgi:SOS-response transcriptional repressor LexA
MFVAQVVGKSMEPQIPDGAYCVFRSPLEGGRSGKVVFVQLRQEVDSESGERSTVKKYEREASSDPDGTWRHLTITLSPRNRDFQPIVLTVDDEGSVAVLAEFIEVLSRASSASVQRISQGIARLSGLPPGSGRCGTAGI